MKSVFASKTFWVNALAVAAMVVQGLTGNSVLVEPETQATLLALANIALRTVTSEAVSWK
jgi:hypothetical protein